MKTIFATLNLYQFCPPPAAWYHKSNTYSAAEWEQKLAWIEEQLKLIQPDVIGFQEVFMASELRAFMSALGYPHFTTIDEPMVISTSPLVLDEPVVALASKHPISSVEMISAPHEMRECLSVSSQFQFSRKPISATVNIPNVGPVKVIVVHLKSKRPMVDPPEFHKKLSWDEKVRESMKAVSRGQVASLLQRSAEAAFIYEYISFYLSQNNNQPCVVMGDLNDDEDSITLAALSNQYARIRVAGEYLNRLPVEAKTASYRYRLFDAYELAPDQNRRRRKPTHFHGRDGKILDYIFVSNALNEKNTAHKGRVVEFKAYNKHLRNDGVANCLQSDHAAVSIEVLWHSSS